MSLIFDLSYMDIYISMAMILFILILFNFAKRNILLRKVFILTTILYNVIYLIWRVVYTLPISHGVISIIFGLILLGAEYVGFLQSLIFRMLFWKDYKGPKHPPKEFEIKPTVDILICTYNEDINLLSKTIAGSLNIEYPKDKLNIYLCDDGNRKEVKELSEYFDINYIARTNNIDAKAGNLNNALNLTNSEFVMTLDADMIPKSKFLKRTINYFTDEKMGFVQTPQVFYTPDPYQKNLGFGDTIQNEQDFFMIDIENARNNFNAVLHIGTNAVFRRKALEHIGGIPKDTVTEDAATGMLIQAKGYNTLFIKEVLCVGLAPETFNDLIKEQKRWCRGYIQIVRKWNPLTLKGLTLAQRIIYFDGFLYWFFGLQKMIYILCPILYLSLGIIFLDISVSKLIAFWLPSFVASILVFNTLIKKRRTFNWSHIYETTKAPFLALTALFQFIFNIDIKFNVTPKNTKVEEKFELSVALPHIYMLLFTVTAWLLTIIAGYYNRLDNLDSTIINIVWSAYNLYAIYISILICDEKALDAMQMEMKKNKKLDVISDNQTASCRTTGVFDGKVNAVCPITFLNQNNKDVYLYIKKIGKIPAEILNSKKNISNEELEFKLNDLPKEEYIKWIKYVYDDNMGFNTIEE